MPDFARPVRWWLVPLVAGPLTVVGVQLLERVQAAAVPALAGGIEEICGAPDCGLGIGVMLPVAGAASVLVALVLAVVLGRAREKGGRSLHLGLALRDIAAVTGCALLGYVIVSFVLWWMIS
ncbi:hypothetical protein [Actinoalloteichus hymeniacidonis]|uniref:Uncharacterized protein n=1 Tax=Actinoalloteichus hymeniacidonis TaxID=340345 RepID=A0AAC9HNK8_9PSEU|nr:hypothetical protein [Actinoalloteichus hymeniacidonis]AOS62408.1 hypothetical protein TL08_07955 [Actinoalloteichus hymeniacidonis]MBB5909561.1 hypothetical protein [Actinoalloteichus hymeniacidonis]